MSNNSVRVWDYVALYEWMSVTSELKGTYKKGVVTYFMVVSMNFPSGIKIGY